MAPLFVLMEFLMLCGFMREFKTQVEKAVDGDLKVLRAQTGKK